MDYLHKEFTTKPQAIQKQIVELGLYCWSLIEHQLEEQKNTSTADIITFWKEKGFQKGKKEQEEYYEQEIKKKNAHIIELEYENETLGTKYKRTFEEEKKVLSDKIRLDIQKEFQDTRDDYIRLKAKLEAQEDFQLISRKLITENTSLKEEIAKLTETKSSAILGKEGEYYIETLLGKLPYDYDMTQYKPEKGDIRVTTKKGKSFIVDSKKYKTNVGKKEKEKLARDVDSDATVCGGILISINTKITHQDHGDIIFTENNKPILLVSLMGMTVDAQIEALHISIKLLEQYIHLHEQKERADLVEKIKQAMSVVKESIQRFTNIEKNAKKILEEAKAGVEKLEPLQKLLINN
jgi:hypothetical protein